MCPTGFFNSPPLPEAARIGITQPWKDFLANSELEQDIEVVQFVKSVVAGIPGILVDMPNPQERAAGP